MSYSGSTLSAEARQRLGQALALLQEQDVPAEVGGVTQHIAQGISALFEAERSSSEPDGKSCVRSAFGSLSQTLALLQDARQKYEGVGAVVDLIAQTMSSLYPLTTAPSLAPKPRTVPPGRLSPVPPAGDAPAAGSTIAYGLVAPVATDSRTVGFGSAGLEPLSPSANAAARPPVSDKPVAGKPFSANPVAAPVGSEPLSNVPTRKASFGVERRSLEVNVGATTESNFFLGFSGDIGEGGVFVATYETLPKGTPVHVLVTLPGGYEFQADGRVGFVREAIDLGADSQPGIGIRFEQLEVEHRELVLRFVSKRAPIFYDE